MFEMMASGVSFFKIAVTLNNENIPTKSGKKMGSSNRSAGYYGILHITASHCSGQTAGSDRKKTAKETWHMLPERNPRNYNSGIV